MWATIIAQLTLPILFLRTPHPEKTTANSPLLIRGCFEFVDETESRFAFRFANTVLKQTTVWENPLKTGWWFMTGQTIISQAFSHSIPQPIEVKIENWNVWPCPLLDILCNRWWNYTKCLCMRHPPPPRGIVFQQARKWTGQNLNLHPGPPVWCSGFLCLSRCIPCCWPAKGSCR